VIASLNSLLLGLSLPAVLLLACPVVAFFAWILCWGAAMGDRQMAEQNREAIEEERAQRALGEVRGRVERRDQRSGRGAVTPGRMDTRS